MPYLIISGIMIFVCLATILRYRSYVSKTFNRIDETLDNILNKKPLQPLAKLGNDRISKLQHKAYRIMDMYVSDATIAQMEKQTIQSFISDMSHQMKTPLSGISMYSELLFNTNVSKLKSKSLLHE